MTIVDSGHQPGAQNVMTGGCYLSVLSHVIQSTPRDANKPRILDISDEMRAHNERFGSADDACKAPALRKPDRLLEAVCASIRRGDMARFCQEENGVDMLLVGEQDADLWTEGGEEDGAVLGKAIHAVKRAVDEMIGFYGGGFHSPIMGFE